MNLIEGDTLEPTADRSVLCELAHTTPLSRQLLSQDGPRTEHRRSRSLQHGIAVR